MRRIVIDRRVMLPGMVLPPMDSIDQLLTDLSRYSAPRQQMFCAVNLGRFRQHRSAAIPHQFIRSNAQRWISRDPAVAIRTAAVFSEDQLADGLRRATKTVG